MIKELRMGPESGRVICIKMNRWMGMSVPERLTRTALLLGEEAVLRLAEKRVAVFGIGGVGGYVCEALARSGIGAIDIIDNDTVAASNLNRQIIATVGSIGRNKTDVMRERLSEIAPEVSVTAHQCFFLPENADSFPFSEYDYVVDAVDTVTAKIEIIMRSIGLGVPVISSMGTGNKLDPGRLRVADIYETSVCPLAKVMRHELRKRGVKSLKVVFSDEEPVRPVYIGADGTTGSNAVEPGGEAVSDVSAPGSDASRPEGRADDLRRSGSGRPVPGSTAFVPATAGLLIAGQVVRDLIS